MNSKELRKFEAMQTRLADPCENLDEALKLIKAAQQKHSTKIQRYIRKLGTGRVGNDGTIRKGWDGLAQTIREDNETTLTGYWYHSTKIGTDGHLRGVGRPRSMSVGALELPRYLAWHWRNEQRLAAAERARLKDDEGVTVKDPAKVRAGSTQRSSLPAYILSIYDGMARVAHCNRASMIAMKLSVSVEYVRRVLRQYGRTKSGTKQLPK